MSDHGLNIANECDDGPHRTTPPLVHMRGITKRFDRVLATDHVDFMVQPGEIHAVLGENGAGKTTLMNILYGLVHPDEGTIEVDGVQLSIRRPRDALTSGIGMVHQHYTLVPTLTVAENVVLGHRPSRPPLLARSEVSRSINEIAIRYGLRVDPDSVVEDLSVGAKQRVEIVKLLYRDARVLILDEPTAVLTPSEWEGLAEVLRALAAAGRGIVLITHKIDELLSVAQTCTVLRDGRTVGSVCVAETDKRSLARMMVGRDVMLQVKREDATRGPVALELRDLSLVDSSHRQRLSGIYFTIREGEVLGIAGVEGNGQSELVEVLVGVRSPTSGEIHIDGRAVTLTPRDFIGYMGAVITEDRHTTGSILDLPLLDNVLMKDFARRPFSRRGILSVGTMRRHCQRLVREYNVRAAGIGVPMRLLSGGNQQKAVLARELFRSPRILVASQPTRGLDLGAAEFVYEQILGLRKSGAGILLISSDLEEVRALADRVAVMVGGRIIRILEGSEANDVELIGLLMAGATEGNE